MSVFAYVFVGVVIAVGVYHQYFSPAARVQRALQRVPRTPVRQITGGIVRVSGQVRPRGDLLLAPVTGRSCVAYALVIEQDNGSGWTELVGRREARPFMVADSSAEALIDPAGCFEVLLHEDGSGGNGWFDEKGAHWDKVVVLLRDAGCDEPTWLGLGRKHRYREGVVSEGELVTVSGLASRELRPDGERPSPREPPELVILRGTPAEPLRISDLPSVIRAGEGDTT